MDYEFTENKRRELKKYIEQIESPSNDFNKFLNDYFIGHPMIRGRHEEDTTVWDRLKDKEYDIAKQMILDNLGHDYAYIFAICIFRDERGIPLLKNLINTLDDKFCFEKLSAAKGLYDWIGYENYVDLLKRVLPKSGEYTKATLDLWINGIDSNLAIHYIFLMLQDESSFVRWCAYGTLLRYYKLGEQKYEETKYYTADDVYLNKLLFTQRMKELKEKIINLTR
jgi:hypothetical protein